MKFIFLWCFFISVSFGSNKLYIQPYLQGEVYNEAKIYFEVDQTERGNFYIRYWRLGEDEIQNSKLVKALPVEGRTRGGNRIAILNNLLNDTNYSYQVIFENVRISKIYSFKTWNKAPKEDFSFIAASDAQHGFETTTRNVRESLMPRSFGDSESATTYPIRFMIFAGDLVQHGDRYEEWKGQFFDPIEPLLAKLPVFPAIGNHEMDHENYFSYFDFPKNGTDGFIKHWYYFDYQNIRFISLDTNYGYRIIDQTLWLRDLLEKTKNNNEIDFVIGYFHHPFKSELWEKGNTDYSGILQDEFKKFSNETNKPSFTFFGHTHGYSRGYAPDSRHTMLNIGSMGGNVDYWGKHEQNDYQDFVKSLDIYGWNLVEVVRGDNPKLILKRFSFGQKNNIGDKGLVDEVTIYRDDLGPKTPKIYNVKKDEGFILISSSPYIPSVPSFHLSTEIEFSKDEKFEDVFERRIINNENVFYGKDLNKGVNLTNLQIKGDFPKDMFVRIRYRSSSLTWSHWSLHK